MDTAIPFPAGAQITVYAMLGDSEVALPGRVIPVKAGSGFGFALDMEQVEESSRQRLEAFIKERSGE